MPPNHTPKALAAELNLDDIKGQLLDYHAKCYDDDVAFFTTARPDRKRDATLLNLDDAGFDGWTELRTQANRDDFGTVQAFKSAERAKVEAEGYTIVANLGIR